MKAGTSGRPLRFFVLLMLGWVGVRLAAQAEFSPTSPVSPMFAGWTAPVSANRPFPQASPSVRPPFRKMATPPVAQAPLTRKSLRRGAIAARPSAISTESGDFFDFARAALAFSDGHFASKEMSATPSPIPFSSIPLRPPSAPGLPMRGNRWQASAWLLVRPGDTQPADVATVGRLGGSQAGLRIDYALAPQSPFRPTLYGRVTRALQSPAAPEAAAGMAVRPLPDLPVSLGIERRIALDDGARDAMAIVIAGGFGPVEVAPKLQAEGYAQTGIVGFRQREAFIDGKLALLTPIDGTPMRVGATVSGGAQPGAGRLDIGPEVQVRLPLPRTAARLSIEWRERIAGDAAPMSGLAITLAADF